MRDQPVRQTCTDAKPLADSSLHPTSLALSALEATSGRRVVAAGGQQRYTSLLNHNVTWRPKEFGGVSWGVLLSEWRHSLQRWCVGCICRTATNGVAALSNFRTSRLGSRTPIFRTVSPGHNVSSGHAHCSDSHDSKANTGVKTVNGCTYLLITALRYYHMNTCKHYNA